MGELDLRQLAAIVNELCKESVAGDGDVTCLYRAAYAIADAAPPGIGWTHGAWYAYSVQKAFKLDDVNFASIAFARAYKDVYDGGKRRLSRVLFGLLPTKSLQTVLMDAQEGYKHERVLENRQVYIRKNRLGKGWLVLADPNERGRDSQPLVSEPEHT